MNNNNLGLPLEYTKLSEYFDAHNVSDDTDNKNALIEKLLKNHNVKTVLDLTCGTGSQVFYLNKHGYEVVGADFSPKLLELARKKAKQGNIDVQFIDGDMREIQVGKFDAVITIFNAIGHLIRQDFEMALQNIRNNLKDGGIYVFDIFNLEAITDDILETFKMDIRKKVNNTEIHNTQYSTIDHKLGLLTSYDNYTITKNDGSKQEFQHQFTLQIYTARELKEILARNGFKILKQQDMNGMEFVENITQNMLTVALKI